MISTGNIEKMAREKIENSELFLVEVVIKPGNKIFVFLDGDRDVTIDDCVSLSRHLHSILPEEENFELMVSSCGADRPLKLPRQYNKHIGRGLTVNITGEKPLSGTLEEISTDGVVLRPPSRKKKKGEAEQPETVFVPFEKIETAKVNISFNK